MRGGRTFAHEGPTGQWDVTVMSTIDFFEYLVRNESTRELAHELADVWVAHEVGYLPELQSAA